MTEWIKLELIVDPPANYRAEQLGWTYEEPRRLARRRTMVEPAGPCLFRILEPSLMRAFSYRDVIEAVPLGGDVWRFSRVFTKSPYRQTFLSPELLIPIIYYQDKSSYLLIRTIYDMLAHGDCAVRHFDDWIILGHPPDLPFDPMARINPPKR